MWGEETVCGACTGCTGCTGLVGVEVGHMAKSLSDNALFCAKSSSRCFSSRARQAFSSNSFTFVASSAALASACFFSVAALRLRACRSLPRRSSSTSCEAEKDEVKHLVQGRVNIRRRGGGGGVMGSELK